MTATTTRSARNDQRVRCPHCTYSVEPGATLQGHISMSHPEQAAEQAAVHPDQMPAFDAPAPEPTQELIAEGPRGTIADLPLDLVDVGHNVRINVAELEELAASIAEHGVLQPIKATGPHADGRYLVTWGQRRTLASRMAGRTSIRAIVLPPTAAVDPDGAARSIEQLVENLHRADLNPIDRAEAMRAVVDSGVSQADLARKLGIAPSTVANDLRILTLDAGVLESIRVGQLSPAHGKAIASLPAKQQRELATAIVAEKLSAHALENRLKWKQGEAKADEERVKRSERLLAKLPAVLGALEAGTTVHVALSGYQYDLAPITKVIKAAGLQVTDRYLWDQPKAGCACLAVNLNTSGQKLEAKPACLDDSHRETARAVDRSLEIEAQKAFAARSDALRGEIERQLRAADLHPLVAALLERSTRPYSGGEDSVDAVAAIAENVVRNWQVRERLTPELVAELGVAS